MTHGKYKKNNHPLMKEKIVSHIEKLVSEFIKKKWRVKSFKNLDDFASHPCAILSDDDYSVFVKLSTAPNAKVQFECEVDNLNVIRELSEVKTPLTIGVSTFDSCSIMVLEAVKEVERKSRHWRDIGRTLAKLHQIKSDYFGFKRHSYFGPLYLDNRPLEDWTTFYAERRILPFLKIAVDSGNLPKRMISKVEKLAARLPKLCGPEVEPSLLHGDAQQNNYISTEEETFFIDTSVYFGHPELDLALIDYFQPVPDEVFQGYHEIRSIEPGFEERKDLWRIFAWLGCVAVGGKSYINHLNNSLQKYL